MIKQILVLVAIASYCLISDLYACVTPSPDLHVGPPVSLPGGRPPREEGTVLFPFRSIKKAAEIGAQRKYCTTTLRLSNGVYKHDGSPNYFNLTIIGENRDKTIIEGGLYSYGPVSLTLEKLSVRGSAARLILVQGGELKAKEIAVLNYQYLPRHPQHQRPTAIGIMNAKASITGLYAEGGHQPTLRAEGSKSRVKATLVIIKNTVTSSGADTSESTPARNAAAIEVTDHAIANLLITDIKNVQYAGIQVDRGASLYAAQLYLRGIYKSSINTKTTISGLFLTQAKNVHLNGFRIHQSTQAGIVAVSTFVTLQKGVISHNEYGIVDRNGSDINGVNGYNTIKCTTSLDVDYFTNATPYIPNDDLPLPPPIDVPPPECIDNNPQTACNKAAPAPETMPPPVFCPSVLRL